MQENEFRLEDYFPVIYENGRQRLMLPNQMELITEDGTVYHVRSFFVGNRQMGELLDALTVEKIDRTA